MSEKFSSWVSRSDVEATMGVESGRGGKAVVETGPGKSRTVDMPVDLFGLDGQFVGLGFDEEVYSLAEITEMVQDYVRATADNHSLIAVPVFRHDRTFSGFHIVEGTPC